MTFDQDTPLSRIERESIKAHNALMDYFLMGSNRSLEKLRQSYVKATSEKAPTIHLRTLQNWSSRYHWQARITRQAANDNAIILQKIEDDNATRLAEYQARHMSEAEALALLADQARGNMADFAAIRAQSDLSINPKAALVKNITQHYTRTTRGTGDDTQAEIKARIVLGLYDAQRALELILKHHGSFEKDNKSELNITLTDSPRDKLLSKLDSIAANTAASDDPGRTD